VQLACRSGDRPMAGDRRENAKSVEVEHSSTVSMGYFGNKH
jgi:hypothetical protein